MNELVDGPVTVHVGDALSVLRQLPSESVHMVCTSPPYWGLRDYGTAEWEGGEAECDHKSPRTGGSQQRIEEGRKAAERGYVPSSNFANYGDRWTDSSVYRDLCGKCGARRIDSQLGLESTPELYVEHLVEVFREVKRVLRRDGTCWLNLGDSYNSQSHDRQHIAESVTSTKGGGVKAGEVSYSKSAVLGLKPKDLVGIPWRVAFALQADGWWLRRDVIWAKPNPMPESVTDRPTSSHEYLFLLTRSERYYYDADAVREADAGTDHRRGVVEAIYDVTPNGGPHHGIRTADGRNGQGRNLRSVWTIATQPVSDAHFATYPEALVIPCIKAGTSEHGVCAECGAPWERVVERSDEPDGSTKGSYFDRGKTGVNGQGRVQPGDRFKRIGIGWRPTCAHDAQPVPATVLDPFAGSGTTLAVARRLGRRAIGIELQADYLPLIKKRIEGSALPLLEIL